MVDYPITYKRSWMGNYEDVVLFDTSKRNQQICNIVLKTLGTKTDTLSFTVKPSCACKNDFLNPTLRKTILYDYNPFVLVESTRNIDNSYNVVFASPAGYVSNLSYNVERNVGMTGGSIALQVGGCLAAAEHYQASNMPHISLYASGSAITAPEVKMQYGAKYGDIIEKMLKEMSMVCYRVSSSYISSDDKYRENYGTYTIDERIALRKTYEYNDIAIISSYKRSSKIQDIVTSVAAYKEPTRKIDAGPYTYDYSIKNRNSAVASVWVAKEVGEDSDITTDATAREMIGTCVKTNGVKVDISVNPLLMEPGYRKLELFDTVVFGSNMAPANGSYYVAGIERHLDAPEKTKFILAPI